MKTCVICKQDILEDREKWVRLTDYDCGIQTGEVYYHYECWSERFRLTNSKRKMEMYKQTQAALKNIKENFSRLNNGGIMVAQ